MKKTKRFLKYVGWFLLAVLVIGAIALGIYYIKWNNTSKENLALLGSKAPLIENEGLTFRDLNKNGRLDVYEDRRRPVAQRVENLLGQMNLEEKAGLLFIDIIAMGPEGELNEVPSFKDPITFAFDANSTFVVQNKMSHFNIVQAPEDPKVMVRWNNNIQEMGERTRLGIPITIASDPRHGVRDNPGAGIESGIFSEWPSPLGLAATRDSVLVQEFGSIANKEYRAVGIRLALHPTADLATEPRWSRISDTFGEDAELSARLTAAYLNGFQGDPTGISTESVACMTKHFTGGGPQKDGMDAHFASGKEQVYPGDNFAYHLIPFEAAIAQKTAFMMPYYGIPVNQTKEKVAFGFNKEIITGLLRNTYAYDGIICTDWAIISDTFAKPASDWGMEDSTPLEKVQKVIDAGCDMFGGEALPELVVQLVQEKKISEERLNASVRRVLKNKFDLGLFDDPYVNEKDVNSLRSTAFMAKGKQAQRRSLTLLKNEKELLPLSKKSKVYLQGFNDGFSYPDLSLTDDPEDADYIILKLNTPYEPGNGSFLERFFKQGRLDFPEKERDALLDLISKKPTITVLSIDRPPVIPEIDFASTAVIADFFASENIILDLITGKFGPTGKLPLEIPSSMEAVKAQKEDLPYDSASPLYSYGHGLGYQ